MICAHVGSSLKFTERQIGVGPCIFDVGANADPLGHLLGLRGDGYPRFHRPSRRHQ